MKAAENFEKTSVEEAFDENLFIEFMKKVAIYGIILLLARMII